MYLCVIIARDAAGGAIGLLAEMTDDSRSPEARAVVASESQDEHEITSSARGQAISRRDLDHRCHHGANRRNAEALKRSH